MASLPDHLSAAPIGQAHVPRETLEEHQRDRILNAAIGVFAKRGYRQTTIDNLIKSAKSSVGSFYYYFTGKEDCFLALYDRIVEDAMRQIQADTASLADWADQALAGISILLELFNAEPLEARVALVEVQTAGPAAREKHDATIDAAIAWLRSGREHYPEARDLPATFEQAAVGGVAWFLQQCLETSAHPDTEELLVDTTQILLEPILGERDLARRRRALLSAA